jgi:hypothetical protein
MFHRGEPLTETVWERLMLRLSPRRLEQHDPAARDSRILSAVAMITS